MIIKLKKKIDLKKELNERITKKNFKDIKYVNFNDEIYRRFKFIKRVITLINITTFKIILHISHFEIFIINNFINFKSTIKYFNVKKFYIIKNSNFYKS